MHITTILVLLTLLAAGATPAAAQAPPPDADWRTFSTAHFRVTFTPELEGLARHAADVAERTYAILREELADPPAGVIDMVVTDHVDFTNGYATPFPSNRIVVFARPPTAMPQLAYSRDWMELVVAHELVHIFHLDETGLVGKAFRAIFGQFPMIWPIFPVAGSPNWNVEGLATYYESRLTGAGRIPGSFHEMMTRAAVLEDELPELDEVSAPHPGWPGGQRSYGYGGRLMDYIAERWGPEAHRAIIEETGASIRPTFLMFDHVSEDAVGEPFDAIYEEWRRQAASTARATAEAVRAEGITPTVAVAGEGPFAGMPRVSPDGRTLSFAAHDYRSDPATRLVDLSTGATWALAERNQFGSILGPAAWLPDGTGVVVAQLEMHGPYRIFSDLWRVDLDGREHRLTTAQRIAQPAVAPDGRRVAAVRSGPGRLELVVHDLETGDTRVLVHAGQGEAFDAPRWSPAGDRIAVGRSAAGRVDVVVIDVATGRLTPVTEDDALDLGPAWSPDGHWLFWWSDRTGIPNIMATPTHRAAPAAAVDPAAGADAEPGPPVVYQVTNLLTGGFDPEVSPDGSTLYLSVYHYDGWRIERMPLDPEAWRRVPESTVSHQPGLLGESAGPADTEPAAASEYSSWPTVRPYFWVPEWGTNSGPGGDLTFLGLYTSGRDLVSRHDWELSAAVDLGTWRFRGSGSWVYRGLGNPDLRLSASRAWGRVTAVAVTGGEEAIYRRTDRISGEAFFWRPRWRSTTWLRVGASAQRRELEPHDLTIAELRAEGYELGEASSVGGVSVSPGYLSAGFQPFSISPEGGVSGSFSLGRWWDLGSGAHAYDELLGRAAGYLDFPAWGFADHVLAVRTAGLLRDGDGALPVGVGGVPGGATYVPRGAEDLLGGAGQGEFLPVRGFQSGVRAGTRAWSFNGEWRFPLHLRDAPGRVLGFSLTSLASTFFVDAADAWCPTIPDGPLHGCSAQMEPPLLSAGAELAIDFGLFHNMGAVVRAGVAKPLRGPGDLEPSAYLSFGHAF